MTFLTSLHIYVIVTYIYIWHIYIYIIYTQNEWAKKNKKKERKNDSMKIFIKFYKFLQNFINFSSIYDNYARFFFYTLSCLSNGRRERKAGSYHVSFTFCDDGDRPLFYPNLIFYNPILIHVDEGFHVGDDFMSFFYL